jgi:hypothetical protein
LFAAALVLLTAAPAYAQTEIVQSQRTPYLELMVTAALFAGVVFAVCRNSRRN